MMLSNEDLAAIEAAWEPDEGAMLPSPPGREPPVLSHHPPQPDAIVPRPWRDSP